MSIEFRGCQLLAAISSVHAKSFNVDFSQFWSAYVPCDGQYKDALRRLVEQMDVIKRLVGKYPDQMFFATTAAGKMLN